MPWGVVAAAAIPAVIGAVSGGGGGGKDASVVQQPTPAAQSTVSPTQQGTQSQISAILQQILAASGYPGTYNSAGPQAANAYAAPISAQQQALINSIVGAASPGSQTSATQGTAMQALSQILTSQPLDYSQAFNAVAQPLQQQFTSSTLPAIMAAAGTSAGGKYQGGNTGINYGIDQATRNLTNAEGNAAGTLAYNSQQANLQNILTALNLTPSVSQAPITSAGAALQSATLPQATQQQQLTGQYADYQSQMDSFLKLLLGAGGYSTSTDVAFPQGNTVVQPATPSIFSGILSGLASNSGLGNAAGNALSKYFSTPTPT